MRIVIYSITFCEYNIQLANALAAHGHEVLLVVPESLVASTVGNAFQTLLHPDVRSHIFDLKKRRRPGYYRDLLAAMRRYHPEIIHIHENGEWETLAILLGCRRVPKVMTIHDITPHPGRDSQAALSRRIIRKLAARQSDMIHVHSPGLGRKLKDFRPHLSSRMEIIPHGTLSLFQHWAHGDIKPEATTCLFFGRMEKYRGLDNLLKMADRLKKALPTIKIIVAGRGAELTAFRAALEEKGIFEIRDAFIPDQEIHVLFRRASLLLLPYHEASQSGVISMGLPFGLPFVATAVGAIPEVITDGVHGRLVEPGDLDGFADAMLELLQDESLRARMRKACLDLAHAYDFTALAPAYERLYRQAIQRKRA